MKPPEDMIVSDVEKLVVAWRRSAIRTFSVEHMVPRITRGWQFSKRDISDALPLIWHADGNWHYCSGERFEAIHPFLRKACKRSNKKDRQRDMVSVSGSSCDPPPDLREHVVMYRIRVHGCILQKSYVQGVVLQWRGKGELRSEVRCR